MKAKSNYKSKCCNAEVISKHGCDDDLEHGGKPCTCTIGTNWDECTKCGEPCVFYDPEYQENPAEDFAETLENDPQAIIDWAYSEIEEYKKLIKILKKKLKQ